MELRICQRCQAVHPGATACPGCRGALTLADHTLFVGRTLGKYRIDSVLGAGGMGVVYGAMHQTLARRAAVKVVLPAHQDESFQKRFLREAQVLAELKHPNIVEVYDFDVGEWGVPFYVMEYLPGQTLRALLDSGARGRAFPFWAPLLQEVAAGLSFAHSKGVVHRDLKPENLFVASFGDRTVAKILDFGIAKLVRPEEGSTRLTASGVMVGTPAYLAPEQILAQEVGPAADQYALALVVAEMLAGRAVREGKTLGEIYAVSIQAPLPQEFFARSDVAPAVKEALQRATEPRPEDRFPDVAAMVAALGAGATAAVGDFSATGVLPLVPGMVSQRVDSGAIPTVALATPAGRQGTLPTTAPSPQPSQRPRWLHYAVAGALLAVLAAGYIASTRRTRRSAVTSSTGAIASPAGLAVKPLLAVERTMATPTDVTDVLALSGKTMLLAGPDCVYVMPHDGTGNPSRVQLAAGTTPLGAAGGTQLFLRSGASVVVRDFGGDAAEVRWAVGVPDAPHVVLAPGGGALAAVHADRIDVLRRTAGRFQPAFSIAAPAGGWDRADGDLGRLPVALGRRFVAVAAGGRVMARAIADGSVTLDTALAEPGVIATAVDDVTGLVAVAGWFNRIDVFAPGGRRSSISHRGRTVALTFLPDHPTLIWAGEGGIGAWRPGRGVVAAPSGDVKWAADRALPTGEGILALDRRRRRVDLLAYEDLDIVGSVQVAAADIWAVAPDPRRDTVYVGAGCADGTLYAVGVASGTVMRHPLHDQGITALATDGEHLASASDDKTIAVWQLPAMQVRWRSQAHGFLVNALRLSGDPTALWSASSDGTVKKWGWPALAQEEEISTQKLMGKRRALHALWVAPDESSVVAGTWQSEAIVFARVPGSAWKGQALPTATPTIYAAADFAPARAVLLVGLFFPAGVYLLDLDSGRLYELETFGASVITAAAAADGSRAWVFGEGAISEYRVTRAAGGGLRYSVTPRFDSRLGELGAGAMLAGGARLVAGNGAGQLQVVSTAAFGGAPAYDTALGAGK